MNLPNNIANLSAIGSDEVGVGDYLGPLVVASVYVNVSQIATLQALGVKDSKGLTDKRICAIASQVKNTVDYQILTLPNDKYNKMVEHGINAHGIKSFLHNKAIGTLQAQLGFVPDYIIVDEFTAIKNHFKYLEAMPKVTDIMREKVHFIKKGESVHIAVAAASILARAAFVEFMDHLSAELQSAVPKGAGAHVDDFARQILSLHGEEKLRAIAKWHFANTKKVLQP